MIGSAKNSKIRIYFENPSAINENETGHMPLKEQESAFNGLSEASRVEIV